MPEAVEPRNLHFYMLPRNFLGTLKFERHYLKRCWGNRNLKIKPKLNTYCSQQILSDLHLLTLSPFFSRLVYFTYKFKDVVIQLSGIIPSLSDPQPHSTPKTLKLHNRLCLSLESQKTTSFSCFVWGCLHHVMTNYNSVCFYQL